MSRTLSYAMPKKRQFGGLVGSTPQLSQPLPMGNPIGGVVPPAPQYGIDSQRMINAAGGLEQAKGAIEAAHSTNLGFGNTKPGVGPKANQMSVTKLQHGGDARRSQLPTTDMGGGKRLGFIGGDGAHGRLRYVVTGGLGVRPAIPGRIGYRGTLQANNQGGLAAYYASLRDTQQARAARSGIDPVSKLSYLPTDREINAQLEMLGKKYGPYEAQLLRDYHQAVNIGDRDKQDQAEKAIRDRRAEMEKERSAPIAIAPTNTGGQNPAGIPVQQAQNQALNVVGQGTVLKNNPDTESLKKENGGKTASIKPYIVNENGEEAWQPDGEKPQLIPGKEKMVLFPKDGKVIPHGRTMEMVKKGKVEMPEHRVKGGDTPASLAERKTYAQRKAEAKKLSLREFNKELQGKLKKEDIDLLKKSILGGSNFPMGSLAKAPQLMAGIGTVPQANVEEYQSPIEALYSLYPGMRKSLATYADMGGELPEGYLKSWAMEPDEAPQAEPTPGEIEASQPMSADDIAAYAEPDLTEFQNPQIPAALKKPEIPQPDYLGDAMKAAKELPQAPTQKPAFSPEEQALLLQGQQMQQRGLSEIGPHGVKFASGGGIENGKAFGPHVVPQPQAPVNIRPGVIKDELGDVGVRLAKQKEDKEFMKRWENDLNKEGGRTKSFA